MFRNILSYILISVFFLLLSAQSTDAAERKTFKPFVLASSATDQNFDTAVTETRAKLEAAGFQVLGEYAPYKESFVKNAMILIVTNPDLLAIAKDSVNGGFAAPWRVSITETRKDLQVTYVNPVYIQHAYRLKGDMSKVSSALEAALGMQEHFGSRRGLSARKLARYHYTIGMERFQNVYLLGKHESHEKALEVLESNLASNDKGLGKIYRLDLDDNVSVFGVSRDGPTEAYRYMDDHFIMKTVDFKKHKGTAYLPYEIMVQGNRIIALHMRYRMAVHFPDLTMMGKNSFMTLRPSPKEIAWAFSEMAKAK